MSQFLELTRAEECESGEEKKEKATRYPIISLEWDEVRIPATIAIWIFVACVAKISRSNTGVLNGYVDFSISYL